MDISARKAQFSIAYIKAIAAQVGLNPSIDDVDNDSVDLRLVSRGYTDGPIRNPQLDIQLKCTSQKLISDNELKFPLGIKNYNDLRGVNVLSPRYLMILVVPSNVDEWITYNNNDITLSNCCYWYSLRQLPETTNKENVTLTIPTAQKVNAELLTTLMRMASQREFY